MQYKQMGIIDMKTSQIIGYNNGICLTKCKVYSKYLRNFAQNFN
jgi:hypothetical protein